MDEPKQPWWYEDRWFLSIGAVVILLLIPPAAFMAWAAYAMLAPGIPYSKMERLQVGMTAAEVRDLIGNPESVGRSPDGGEHWHYCPGTWAMYEIEFDAESRIAKHWHDY